MLEWGTNLKTMFGWHVASFFGFWQIVSYQVQVDSLGTYENLDVKLDEIGPMDIFGDC